MHCNTSKGQDSRCDKMKIRVLAVAAAAEAELMEDASCRMRDELRGSWSVLRQWSWTAVTLDRLSADSFVGRTAAFVARRPTDDSEQPSTERVQACTR